MDTNSNTGSGYPELMAQPELIAYLRIPQASTAGNYANVIDNLKRFHGQPRWPVNPKYFPSQM